mgnify:FL=1
MSSAADELGGLDKGTLLRLYRTMLTIRRFEESIADLYRRGLVPSSAHVYIGQEAVAAGVCACLRPDDYVLSTHRGHAHSIAKGAPLERLAAEILGRATGLNRGRGGSMRPCCPDVGVLYSCPIVGSNIPIAAGVGLAIRLRGTDQVVACFFGDGASNIGDFHEGLNLAAIWRAPVIYVCENNQYAISVPVWRSTSVRDIAARAASYGIPGVVVDGNDVIAVYKAAKWAVERARRGEGPALIECKTYRWLGHHVGDPGTAYRTREEVEAWKARCPIKRLRERLLAAGIASEEELARLEAEVEEAVGKAMKFALNSPFPGPEELHELVY